MNYQIIPIIMTDSIKEVEQKVAQLQELSVERVSIDILDGLFADNTTVGVDDMWELDFGEIVPDVQLMVEEPTDYLGQVSGVKATKKRVYGHVEKMGHRDEFVALVKDLGLELGWALDLHTPIDELSQEELLRADGVLLMAVKAGFSGQIFQPLVLEKIKHLRQLGFEQDICVDGGLNSETIPLCLEAGANHLAINTALWEAENLEKQFTALSKLLPK